MPLFLSMFLLMNASPVKGVHANLQYLGNNGWLVETASVLLLIDYQSIGDDSLTLAIEAQLFQAVNQRKHVYIFSSREECYDRIVQKWLRPSITIIYAWDIANSHEGSIQVSKSEKLKLDDLDIYTYETPAARYFVFKLPQWNLYLGCGALPSHAELEGLKKDHGQIDVTILTELKGSRHLNRERNKLAQFCEILNVKYIASRPGDAWPNHASNRFDLHKEVVVFQPSRPEDRIVMKF